MSSFHCSNNKSPILSVCVYFIQNASDATDICLSLQCCIPQGRNPRPPRLRAAVRRERSVVRRKERTWNKFSSQSHTRLWEQSKENKWPHHWSSATVRLCPAQRQPRTMPGPESTCSTSFSRGGTSGQSVFWAAAQAGCCSHLPPSLSPPSLFNKDKLWSALMHLQKRMRRNRDPLYIGYVLISLFEHHACVPVSLHGKPGVKILVVLCFNLQVDQLPETCFLIAWVNKYNLLV